LTTPADVATNRLTTEPALKFRPLMRLFAGSGAHAVYEGHPLQVAFRNISVGAQHASLDFDSPVEQYGRVLLGVGAKTGGS
jgi:hypothetical protein